MKTFFNAWHKVRSIKKEELNSFLASYQLFNKDQVLDETDHKSIMDYYTVLNSLCALGNVEKMYIPPIINSNLGVKENQDLFEKKMAEDLEVVPGQEILDMGCGRGRIAHHLAELTGTHVTGINIDRNQIEAARAYAVETHFEEKTKFVQGNYNNPLEFPDDHFDAIYQVQAFTYAEDLDKLFKEIYRVLKPGAKFSWLDWVALDAYDPNNELHQKLMAGTKAVIGAVFTEKPEIWIQAMKRAGFNIIKHEIPSVNGVQYPLIERESKYFHSFESAINFLVRCKMAPPHFQILLNRFNQSAGDFIQADKMRLCTTVYHILAEKPMN
jgi:sterol 24-C-methyltransferase